MACTYRRQPNRRHRPRRRTASALPAASCSLRALMCATAASPVASPGARIEIEAQPPAERPRRRPYRSHFSSTVTLAGRCAGAFRVSAIKIRDPEGATLVPN